MRKLTVATSVALAGLALALPSGASADTAAAPTCPTVVDCVRDVVELVRDLTTCAGSCVPQLELEPCTLITGRPCP